MIENKPRLLDQVRQIIRVKHYSLRTEALPIIRLGCQYEQHIQRNKTRIKDDEIQ